MTPRRAASVYNPSPASYLLIRLGRPTRAEMTAGPKRGRTEPPRTPPLRELEVARHPSARSHATGLPRCASRRVPGLSGRSLMAPRRRGWSPTRLICMRRPPTTTTTLTTCDADRRRGGRSLKHANANLSAARSCVRHFAPPPL